MTADLDRLLTTNQLSLTLAVPLPAIRAAIERGILTPRRAGRAYVFAVGDVEGIRTALAEAGLIRTPADTVTQG